MLNFIRQFKKKTFIPVATPVLCLQSQVGSEKKRMALIIKLGRNFQASKRKKKKLIIKGSNLFCLKQNVCYLGQVQVLQLVFNDTSKS